jgi:transcription factor CP2-like protein
MAAWQASRPGDRIVEVDVPLSYGIYDVVQDQYLLNTVEFLWDPTKEVGVYIKVHTVLLAFYNVKICSPVVNSKLENLQKKK